MTRLPVATPAPWITTLRAVVAAVEASDVRELELRVTGLHIQLRRTGRPPVGYESPLVTEAPDDTGAFPTVRSPLTGIWYEAPVPGAPPYVSVGDTIDVGYVIGLIETMKVFNEVASDAAGVVAQVLVHRGELVMANAPLLKLEPAAETGPVSGL